MKSRKAMEMTMKMAKSLMIQTKTQALAMRTKIQTLMRTSISVE